eukprot:216628-Pyramimonas_sp.AAC.1
MLLVSVSRARTLSRSNSGLLRHPLSSRAVHVVVELRIRRHGGVLHAADRGPLSLGGDVEVVHAVAVVKVAVE